MHLHKMMFGFGVITGAAITISLPYVISKVKEMKLCDDDQEKHESTNIKTMKDDIKQEFSKMSQDVNENVSSVMKKMEKSLSKKKK